jgi:hypothetical protein
MTYLVGIEYNGVNFIIADTRMSAKSRDGHNFHMKTFRLFPGCIGGWAGYIEPARKFVIDFKTKVEGIVGINDLWKALNDFVGKYTFAPGEHNQFKLLLSVRLELTPRFYVLDSEVGTLAPVEQPITLGSGKDLLDDQLYKIIIPQAHKIALQEPNQTAFVLTVTALLFSYSQGERASEMEAMGVGGYFHYSVQASDGEYRQDPTVYVLGNMLGNTPKLNLWIYRVAFAENYLLVDCPITDKNWAIIDMAEKPEIMNYSDEEWDEYKRRIKEADRTQPYYTQAAFMHTNETHVPKIGIQYLGPDNGYFIDRNTGEIANQSVLENLFKKMCE